MIGLAVGIVVVRRHHRKAISLIAIDVTVSWSVCHVRALRSNGWKYRLDFICIRQPHISLRFSDFVKIWLASGIHSSPYFAPEWPPHVDLSVGNIRWQIAAEWLEIAQWSQWRAYRKPPLLFRMVRSLIPYDLPFPKNGILNVPHDHLRVACCLLANMIERRVMSPFAKLLWPLLDIYVNNQRNCAHP